MKNGKDLTVSLCMIVKNEIANLDECLDSVEHLVDEIVIVDTGSEDGTFDVVKRRATVALQREWNGFADARNAAQEAATGDLILILDADETIVDSTGWADAKAQMASGTCDAVAFVVHNQLPDDQVLASDRIWQIRMYANNRPEIKWMGSVHNQIAHALQANPINGNQAKFFQAKIIIDHRGYNLPKAVMLEKYADRMESLKKEIDNAPDDKTKAYYQFQTANALFMQNKYDECLAYVRECDFDKMTDENTYSTCLMAVHCTHILGVDTEGMEYAKRMLDVYPEESMSFLMMGLVYLSKGEPKKAYNFLGAALAQTQMKDMQYKYLLDLHYIAAPCGEAALQLKRYEDAKQLFLMHLEKYPDNERIKALEQAIIPVEQAQARGLIPVDPLTGLAENGQANPGDTLSVPDLRKSDSQQQSGENPSDSPDPISYQQ